MIDCFYLWLWLLLGLWYVVSRILSLGSNFPHDMGRWALSSFVCCWPFSLHWMSWKLVMPQNFASEVNLKTEMRKWVSRLIQLRSTCSAAVMAGSRAILSYDLLLAIAREIAKCWVRLQMWHRSISEHRDPCAFTGLWPMVFLDWLQYILSNILCRPVG